ncbi:hypothetical protein PtB15_10B331 [Puccinia triticina]|nr:hypothetical protein PtB15_10B331 [Puccinia triticina]
MPYRAVREDEQGGRAAEQPGDQPPAAAAGAAGSAGFSGLGAGSLVSRLLFFLTAESSQSRFWWGAAPWLGSGEAGRGLPTTPCNQPPQYPHHKHKRPLQDPAAAMTATHPAPPSPTTNPTTRQAR